MLRAYSFLKGMVPAARLASSGRPMSTTSSMGSLRPKGSKEVSSIVTQDLITRYNQDGAVVLRGLFTKEEVAVTAAAIEKAKTIQGPYSENLDGFFNDYCHWREIEEMQSLVYRSAAAEAAALLMKSDSAVFYHEHVLTKEPGALKPTPWHHDMSYYPVEGNQTCSLWVAVDPVPRATTLRFIAGSHRWGMFYPRKFATGMAYPKKESAHPSALKVEYLTVPPDDKLESQHRILQWDVLPGDVLAFNFKTLHGAQGNTTSIPRRTVALRFVGDDCKRVDRPWEVSPPITGGLEVGDPFVCETFPEVWRRWGTDREDLKR